MKFTKLISTLLVIGVWNVSSSFAKPIYDTTYYEDKSIDKRINFIPAKILYEHKLLPRGIYRIDSEYLINLARELPYSDAPYILDIESWKIGLDIDDLTANRNIDRYIQVIDIMKKARPDLKFGYFGLVPVKPPIYITYPSFKRLNEWKYACKRAERLVSHVDVICPEGYTYTTDKNLWKSFMDASISEARKYRKPILPFLWPEYMTSTPMKGTYLPAEYWKYQITHTYNSADGLIIWGGRDFKTMKVRVWNDEESWWKILKTFIESKH